MEINTKRPRGRPPTIKYKEMTLDERRAYMRVRNNKNRKKRYVPKRQPVDFGLFRECRHCKQKLERTEENFYKNKNARFGLSTICKTCSGKASRAYQVRMKYNGPIEDYEAMMADASCAICGSVTRLVMDHCHDKEHVRGILCTLCNTGIGMFKDDPHSLRAAADYLESTKNGLE